MFGWELDELSSRRINNLLFQAHKVFFYGSVMRIKLFPSLFIPHTVINSGPRCQYSGLCIAARFNRLCLIFAASYAFFLTDLNKLIFFLPTSEANIVVRVLLGFVTRCGSEAGSLPWPTSTQNKWKSWATGSGCIVNSVLILETRSLPLTILPLDHDRVQRVQVALCWACARKRFMTETEIFAQLGSKMCLDSHSVNFGFINKFPINFFQLSSIS